jgi:hypothetical protein
MRSEAMAGAAVDAVAPSVVGISSIGRKARSTTSISAGNIHT